MKIRPGKILLFVALFAAHNLSSQEIPGYASSSCLSSGKWFRMAITSEGIYRIDYNRLKQLGIDNPSNPAVYSNNTGQLSFYNNDPRPDDLRETAIATVTGADGIFNEGDYLLFYANGTHRWVFDTLAGEYNFSRHHYSDTAYYFLTSSDETVKKVGEAPALSEPVSFYSSQSDALFIHEYETENLIKSGREWYQPVSPLSAIKIEPGFNDILTTEGIRLSIKVLARASSPVLFRLYEGAAIHQSVLVPGVDLSSGTGTYARIIETTTDFIPFSSSPGFDLRFYNNGEVSAKGWLDYVTLQGRIENVFRGTTAFYSDIRATAGGRVTEFTVKTTVPGVTVWDISDMFNPMDVAISHDGDKIIFSVATGTLKRFMAFTPDKALSPVIRTAAIGNQDLHGSPPAEMVIVTHPLFLGYAEKLADIHEKNSGLISLIVTPEQVYNEFSGGVPDIAAIRNFMRMKFEQQEGSDHPLRYLLLFGDGSYENKTLPPGNPNFIPTYQSKNSNVVVSSFTSDDFYGLLGEGEGEETGTVDIGIGRLPVSDTAEAGVMVSKTASYLDPANNGDWKNVICITSDDEDDNTHLYDGEGLAATIRENDPDFVISKIYIDAYRQETSETGQSYPDVNRAINDRINSGCLIFNYIGHGNEMGLAHEGIVTGDDIKLWKNNSRLPLFITATCEFSRFDDIDISIIGRTMTDKRSAGEKVLLKPDGGAVALMSTTRLAYSAPNYSLNRNIYDVAFTTDEEGNALRLGDIIKLAKNKTESGINKRNFTLLGDPALRLAWPWHGKIVTDSVNGIPVTSETDTLKALSLVTLSGHVENISGAPDPEFDGVISMAVYDKPLNIKTLANDGGNSVEYSETGNILFRGKTAVENGKFRFTFIVPRDINYNYGNGRISYYGRNDAIDIKGSFSNITVGGFSPVSEKDTTGPLISLYMNNTLFRDGGITDLNPALLAIIEDRSGINTTGFGIGHDLTGYLDDDRSNIMILNSFFENDPDNFRKGKLSYRLTGLNEGSHSVTIKAWDNHNNSSEARILFLARDGERFVLENLINYPNPFISNTSISAEINRPDDDLNITITIFNSGGQLIRIISTNIRPEGYRLPPMEWDRNDERGNRVGRGIYPYNVRITTRKGEIASGSGRMIIL